MKTIPLTRGFEAIVDDDIFDLIAHRKWCVQTAKNTSYAVCHVPRSNQCVFMHRAIMLPPSRLSIDHINGNGLDNRRSNLRFCTTAQNLANQRVKPNKFRGVNSVHHCKSLWRAQIKHNYITKHIGTFPSAEEAARAYDAAAQQLFGEFARLNFPVGAN